MQFQQAAPSSENPGTAAPSASLRSSRRVAVFAWLRRFFFMSDEMARARSCHFAATAPGFAEYEAAKCCMLAVENLREDAQAEAVALALRRDALLFALDAFRARRSLESESNVVALWMAFLNDSVGEQLAEGLNASQRAEIARFVGADGQLPAVPVAEGQQADLARVINTILTPLLNRFGRDAESVQRVWVARLFRWLALAAAVGLTYYGTCWFPRPNLVNIALHKRVELSSSLNPQVYRPEGLVDGNTSTFAIHTMDEERPWAQIDLGQEYEIRRVVVTNRIGVEDRAVPLEIDTSLDGKKMTHFATREKTFQTWEAKGGPIRARYVRLTVARLSALHLSEVEVY